MSISYITEAREALHSTFDAVEFADQAEKAAILREVTLRPPKEKSYGDLSTNTCIILKSKKNIDFKSISEKLVTAFSEMAEVSDVRLEDNGYINIKYSVKHWLNNILLVLSDGLEFGLERIAAKNCVFPAPAEVVDLASFREQANFEALDRIAVLTGAEVVREPLPVREAAGFPHKTAIAKCTEAKTRFAVIANPPGFIDAFSPILAIDRHYDNPVFAIPYARLMLQRLGATAEAAETGMSDGVDMSVLKLPEEVALARLLSDWPLALERSMRKRDAFYLASFLQALSLLFFKLNKRVHPVSSNYLTAEAERPARLCLLGALDVILIGGVRLLGVDAVKEYG
ncbi:DALR anticodon-binding domain-containing protein [Sneathiella sp.]|uniref:DALR anticodon-binding domain-containing protein n=1 Tax=Sneathiella sp. TaxID=1964365 RepID=UPI00261A3499|nr:DALR anticodon-binding domain-containing protein [Sneathiella sp.]MDF2367285.1 DALR anticodon-binding domain-containing protein [Sneathiella sp.]